MSSPVFPAWKWFIEFTHPTQAHMHGVKRYVYSGKTQFQDIEIIDTYFFGRCLVLDGKIQSAQFDEYIYHEALIHPAMIIHPHPREILVIGGGEGAVLREIIKHPQVEKLVMVDIDQEVVELCQRYLPEWSNGAFEDPKVDVHFMDAREYLENTDYRWDIIFIDITEPLDDNPSYRLFTKEFYQLVVQRLKKNGVTALQAGNLNTAFFECHGAVYNTLKLVFKNVESYGAFIPSYDTNWGFIIASNEYSALGVYPAKIDTEIARRNINDLRFYDSQSHTNMFALTKDVRDRRSKEKRIIEDDKPLFTY